MSDTLNYWLGKLSRLQLFGHGTKPLYVKTPDGQVYAVHSLLEEKDRVTIVVD